MDEKDLLKTDLESLKNAYNRIKEVLNDLKDVDGLNEQYNQLHSIAEDINDKRIENEIKLERMEEI